MMSLQSYCTCLLNDDPKQTTTRYGFVLRNGFVIMLHTAKEDVKEQQHIAACNVSNRDRLGPAGTIAE